MANVEKKKKAAAAEAPRLSCRTPLLPVVDGRTVWTGHWESIRADDTID